MSRLEPAPTGEVALAGRHALSHAMPFPLWTLDGRALDQLAGPIRAMNLVDGEALLLANPHLVDAACDAVRVIDANSCAVDLFGAEDRCALLGPMRYLFSAAPDAARRLVAARLAGQRDHVEDITVRTFDGRTREVLLHATFPAPMEPTAAILLLMIDVSGRLRSDELIASIAHEVKQPLAAIVTNAQTSLRWLGQETPNLAKVGLLTGRIAASARRANEILVRAQQAARHCGGGELLGLNALAEEAVEFVRQDAEDRRIELVLALADGLPRVCGDRVQLQQVVVNLLMNAVQAIDQADAPRRRITVSTALERAGTLSLCVCDSGPGVAAGDFERIFARAFTTKPEGMGVGLAICRSIVREHGGAIEVCNLAAGGACFHVLLPAAAVG